MSHDRPGGARTARGDAEPASPLSILLAISLIAFGSLPGLAQDVQKRRGLSIKITQPLQGDIAIGKTRIVVEVKADRPDLVEAVEFSVGDTLVFRDTEPPYECTYDFGSQSVARVIRAVAIHREGVTVSDVVVTRRIDLSFAVRVNRVLLNAVVQNKEGFFVPGLAKDDLTVLEEGKPQQIVDFSLETRPLAIALLVDTSGSMQEKIKDAHEAASGFVDSLASDDRAMIIDFSDKVYLLEDLTGNHEPLRRAIQSTTAIGGTAIYDAVHTTLRKMRRAEGRKAIILLSDGGDTGSQMSKDRIVEEAKAADVTIYTIGLGAGVLDFAARDVMKSFSEATGGRAYFPKNSSDLKEVYAQISMDLKQQYYLTYESGNDTFDGRWIPIVVRSKDSQYSVRARQGYFAVRPPT